MESVESFAEIKRKRKVSVLQRLLVKTGLQCFFYEKLACTLELNFENILIHLSCCSFFDDIKYCVARIFPF